MNGPYDMRVNRLGFGSWQLGNALWGGMAKEEAIKLVRTAIDKGLNLFDTAPGYADGLSETYLGDALLGRRDKVVINSKFGHWANGTSNFAVDLIELSIKESLKRLQTDYLDSLLLHNPSMEILNNQLGHFDELERLRRKGLIRAYGASIDRPEEIAALLKNKGVKVVELLYNVFFQAPREYLDEIASHGIARRWIRAGCRENITLCPLSTEFGSVGRRM